MPNPTQTVSICVNDAEAAIIRDAARAAERTVSAWGAARCAAALRTAQTRAATKAVAERIEGVFAPRGSRKGRISMVVPQADHDALKTTAAKFAMTVHAFAQAALLDAAERELGALPPAMRRTLDAARPAAPTAPATFTLVAIPDVLYDAAQVDELSGLVRQLVAASLQQVRDGKATTILAGLDKTAGKVAHLDHVTVKLYVPEFDLKALAFVLGTPAATLATVLAVKASRFLQTA